MKAYVKRGKTDAADAEAICEAVTRPTMRFVAVKITEQPGVLMLHKTRDLLVRQRTMLINALRGHFTERGIIAAQGAAGVKAAIEAIHTAQDGLPALARNALHGLIDQMRALAREIDKIEKTILTWHSKNAAIRRLAANPRYRANHDERHHGSDTRCDTILLKQPQREAEFSIARLRNLSAQILTYVRSKNGTIIDNGKLYGSGVRVATTVAGSAVNSLVGKRGQKTADAMVAPWRSHAYAGPHGGGMAIFATGCGHRSDSLNQAYRQYSGPNRPCCTPPNPRETTGLPQAGPGAMVAAQANTRLTGPRSAGEADGPQGTPQRWSDAASSGDTNLHDPARSIGDGTLQIDRLTADVPDGAEELILDLLSPDATRSDRRGSSVRYPAAFTEPVSGATAHQPVPTLHRLSISQRP